jgi:hypothetical protein
MCTDSPPMSAFSGSMCGYAGSHNHVSWSHLDWQRLCACRHNACKGAKLFLKTPQRSSPESCSITTHVQLGTLQLAGSIEPWLPLGHASGAHQSGGLPPCQCGHPVLQLERSAALQAAGVAAAGRSPWQLRGRHLSVPEGRS